MGESVADPVRAEVGHADRPESALEDRAHGRGIGPETAFNAGAHKSLFRIMAIRCPGKQRVIEAKEADAAANSPEAQRAAERERDLARAKAENQRYAAESAQYRRGLGRDDTDTETETEDSETAA